MRQLRGQERVITANRQTSWAFADAFVAEDEPLLWARDRAHETGLRPVSPLSRTSPYPSAGMAVTTEPDVPTRSSPRGVTLV
ncbi:hypothetical protein ACWC5G_31185, partial [Streptomyces sp. NPDC001274]